jgi:hypothetical protein
MKLTGIRLSLSATLLLCYGFGFLNVSKGQESETEERRPEQLITEIRSLLNQTMLEYQNKNFSGASALSEKAYLDNYEFIEAPLEEQNETLMEETELMLREQLRDLVKSEGAEANIQMLIEKINSNLEQADVLLANRTETN